MSLQVFPTHSAIPPQDAKHTHTFILLHDRGNNFVNFVHAFLGWRLHVHLPTVKFVFPATPKPAVSESVYSVTQTADNWLHVCPLKGPEQYLDEEKEVLSQAAERIRGIIHDEAHRLGEGGYQRIVLWGLGEGCAAGLFILIGGWFNLRDKCALGAFVGLDGWLPRAVELEDILRCVETTSADEGLHATKAQNDSKQWHHKGKSKSDSRASSSKEAGLTCQVHEDGFLSQMYDLTKGVCYPPEMIPTFVKPLNYVRDLLGLPLLSLDEYLTDEKLRLSSCYHFHTPVFLANNQAGFQISHKIDRQLSIVLSIALRMDVTWQKSEGSYGRSDEFDDILSFLQAQVNLPKAMEITSKEDTF